MENIKYACAVTFGRMALPHFGHCELIQTMLECAEYADVHLSAHDKNNDHDIRVLLLKQMCLQSGVDLRRVNFLKSPSVTEAVSSSIERAPFKEAVLVLGSDQVDMGVGISKSCDTGFVINRRTNSSTLVRHFFNSSPFVEDCKHLYKHDEFMTTLAMVLYKEEIRREKS
jgi:hypothetical protein